MKEKIFIGVAWPYANGSLHLGHIAGAYLPADIFARYHRAKGNDVLMVSGSDQHGTRHRTERTGLFLRADAHARPQRAHISVARAERNERARVVRAVDV